MAIGNIFNNNYIAQRKNSLVFKEENMAGDEELINGILK